MPRTLALMAVQRQTAASRSAKPLRRVQQGVLGGVPTTRCTKSFNRSAHTPSLRVSLGHLALEGLWLGGFGVVGGQGTEFEETMVKKRRLRRRKRAIDVALLEAIGFELCV